MLNETQIKQVEHSFKHGDETVIVVGSKVYVADEVVKCKHEAKVEFRGCYEVDETCFTKDGEYYGDTLDKEYILVLDDEYAGNNNVYNSKYYEDEIERIYDVAEKKIVFERKEVN